MRRAAAGVDVGAVGLGRAARRPRHPATCSRDGADDARRTVGAVERPPAARRGGARRWTRPPTWPSARPRASPSTTVPTAAAGGRIARGLMAQECVQLALQCGLREIVELLAAGTEQLHPVVLERVVRRRDHCSRDGLGGGHPRHGGRGCHAQRDHVGPFGGEPGDERRLEQRTRSAGVPTERRSGGRAARERRPAPERATTSGVRSRLATPRTPSVPNFSMPRGWQILRATTAAASARRRRIEREHSWWRRDAPLTRHARDAGRWPSPSGGGTRRAPPTSSVGLRRPITLDGSAAGRCFATPPARLTPSSIGARTATCPCRSAGFSPTAPCSAATTAGGSTVAGRCTEVPALDAPVGVGDSPRDVAARPVREQDGFVWVWGAPDTPAVPRAVHAARPRRGRHDVAR